MANFQCVLDNLSKEHFEEYSKYSNLEYNFVM